MLRLPLRLSRGVYGLWLPDDTTSGVVINSLLLVVTVARLLGWIYVPAQPKEHASFAKDSLG